MKTFKEILFEGKKEDVRLVFKNEKDAKKALKDVINKMSGFEFVLNDDKPKEIKITKTDEALRKKIIDAIGKQKISVDWVL